MSKDFFALVISMRSKFVIPYVSNFDDCFDLELFVLNPLATPITLLSFLFKDDAKEVTKGYDCGLQVKDYNDIKVGDEIEGFINVAIKKKI